MRNILILSVGGSAEPVVNAIKESRPDFVYFFCSTGPRGSDKTIASPGDPCGDTRKTKCPDCGKEFYIGDPKGKAIAIQSGLYDDYYEIITVDDPDDLDECMQKIKELSEQILARHGTDCRIVANYTGGTKTMSLALGLCGILTERWDLAVNRGPRTDLIKVRGGDVPVAVDKWRVYCELQLEAVREAIRQFDYGHAAGMLTGLLSRPLDRDMRIKLMHARQVCQAFDHWDRFAHGEALDLLQPFGRQFSVYLVALKKILGLHGGSGYEQVGDLINNAARKAHRKLYDDAVARLYRATELFAQIRLHKRHALPSGDFRLDDLPEHLRDEYAPYVRDKGKILLGLRDDYELLHKLGDPVGAVYMEKKNALLEVLTKRNQSISAHGLTPLAESDYRLASRFLNDFITGIARQQGINLDVPQLPAEGIL